MSAWRAWLLGLLVLGAVGCDGDGAGPDGGRGDGGGLDGAVDPTDGGPDPDLDAGGDPDASRVDGSTDGGSAPDGGADGGDCRVVARDADGDGYGSAFDRMTLCDPDAPVPDGYLEDLLDVDCDDAQGHLHEGVTAYRDLDADGYGSGRAVTACVTAAGLLEPYHALVDGDCDDAVPDPGVNPGLLDFPGDPTDNDCDGSAAPVEGAGHLFVDRSVAGPGTGTASDPFSTIGAALTEAATRGAGPVTVVVAGGVYAERVTMAVSDARVLIAGGYVREPSGAWRPGLSGDPPTELRPATNPAVSVSAGELQLARLDVHGAALNGGGVQRAQAVDVTGGTLVLQYGARVEGPVVTGGSARANAVRLQNGALLVVDSAVHGGRANGGSGASAYAQSVGIVAFGDPATTELRVIDGVVTAGIGSTEGGGASFARALFQDAGRLEVYRSALGDAAGADAVTAEGPVGAHGLRVANLAGATVVNTSIRSPRAEVTAGSDGAEVFGLEAIGTPLLLHDARIGAGTARAPERTASHGVRIEEASEAWLRGNAIFGGRSWSRAAPTAGRAIVHGARFVSTTAVVEANRIGSGRARVEVSGSAGANASSIGVEALASDLVLVDNAIAALGPTEGAGPFDVGMLGLYASASTVTSLHNVYVGGVSGVASAQSSSSATIQLAPASPTPFVSVNDAIVPGVADTRTGLARGAGATLHLFHTAFAQPSGTGRSFVAGDGSFDGALLRAGGTAYTDVADLEGCSSWSAGCGTASGLWLGPADFEAPEGAFDDRDYRLPLGAVDLVDQGLDPRTVDYAGLGVRGHLGLADADVDGDARPQGAGWDIGLDEVAP